MCTWLPVEIGDSCCRTTAQVMSVLHPWATHCCNRLPVHTGTINTAALVKVGRVRLINAIAYRIPVYTRHGSKVSLVALDGRLH